MRQKKAPASDEVRDLPERLFFSVCLLQDIPAGFYFPVLIARVFDQGEHRRMPLIVW